MNSKAMEGGKRNGGASAPKNPRQLVEAKRASGANPVVPSTVEKKSLGKIPNK
jgi:hypothetical protein